MLSPDQEISIDLKDPVLAAFLAWLIPGLGHLYQGRLVKAALFFVMIMGTFVFGVYLGSGEGVGWGRVVYASWRDDDKRLAYLCQIGVGLPALPAIVQAIRVRNGKAPWSLYGVFMAPPRLDSDMMHQPGETSLSTLHYKLNRFFELGTVYTMIAGLLNVLAIYDAWGGPVFLSAPGDDSKAGEDEETGESADNKRTSAQPKS
jgi:hypothetical protein